MNTASGVTEKSLRLKLSLSNETHSLLPPKAYSDLILKLRDVFGKRLPSGFRMYYFDPEGDLILVTTQDDYEAALLQARGSLKFYIDTCAESVRQSVVLVNHSAVEQPEDARFEFVNLEEPTGKSKESTLVIPEEEKTKQPALCPNCKKPKTTCSCGCVSDKEALIEQFAEQIKSMVKLELSRMPASEIESRMGTMLLSQSAAAPVEIPAEQTCTVCGKSPIQPVIYKCVICPKLYLCEACEHDSVHEHPLMKVRLPAGAKQKEGYTEMYKAEFFDSNGRVDHPATPGQTLHLDWIARNVGARDWPAGTEFVQVGGFKMNAKPYAVGTIKSGAFVRFRLDITASLLDGTYTTFFQLQCNGHGLRRADTRFGQKVSATVVVSKEKVAAAAVADPESGEENGLGLLMARLGVPRGMQGNMVKLMELCADKEPMVLFRALRQAGNNLQKAADSVFTGTN